VIDWPLGVYVLAESGIVALTYWLWGSPPFLWVAILAVIVSGIFLYRWRRAGSVIGGPKNGVNASTVKNGR